MSSWCERSAEVSGPQADRYNISVFLTRWGVYSKVTAQIDSRAVRSLWRMLSLRFAVVHC